MPIVKRRSPVTERSIPCGARSRTQYGMRPDQFDVLFVGFRARVVDPDNFLAGHSALQSCPRLCQNIQLYPFDNMAYSYRHIGRQHTLLHPLGALAERGAAAQGFLRRGVRPVLGNVRVLEQLVGRIDTRGKRVERTSKTRHNWPTCRLYRRSWQVCRPCQQVRDVFGTLAKVPTQIPRR